ncbi:hypothetical protein K432DRAFT_392392 [Lepidopterella palustris CBS 459.81]|uniref:UspA domain-containing protein n=1 Tax=Lepidopterella palustris CBS 459.81 TaxID=1314670 RepID=A0A8E2JGL3_9PEZI|nr:hypothetical protein K432DRAFT_392392 [Lepidopterella palustris CBS 459.81]
MSLESALDEERREVIALLEGRTSVPHPKQTKSPSVRAQSPAAAVSPVRSMLDIGATPAPRHASLSGAGIRSTNPNGASYPSGSSNVRSMLDYKSPPPSTRSPSRGPASPPPASRTNIGSPTLNPESAYQFEMMPTIESHSLPKRVTQGGKKNKSNAMASVYSTSADILGTSRDRGHHNSTGGFLGKTKSSSPAARVTGRSVSPGGRMLNTNSFNLMPDPNKYMLDSGKVVDMQSAYRRLSDAALLRSGGTLASLPSRKGSDPTKGESLAPGGGIRLSTDDFGDEDEAALESSNDENEDSEGSSDAESWGAEKRRGRGRTRQTDSKAKNGGEAKKKPKSLLAAAEDERKEVSSSYKVRSLLEPTVTVTGPNGEKMTTKKTGVHPHTNFDQGGSGFSTPMSSDTEADISEIKKAQQMALSVSPIHSSPEAHRCVRQIIRGNWRQFQADAEKGLRRQRVYLVATDISEEAAYALEWTIGTVLRDGDTLLAVYAVDEETGTGAETAGVAIGEGAAAQQETAFLMNTLSTQPTVSADGHNRGPSPLHNSLSVSEPDFITMEKAEKERWQAAIEVSDRCVKLLRRTRLQVRVVVEVFHCKSPKHMITEVIDFLEPTLVILGSRGRSALKGVLLGSFSNYLVTKSSVPVMVARKRLRKHSKYKRRNLRLSNVLTNPTSKLASAKID